MPSHTDNQILIVIQVDTDANHEPVTPLDGA
jgi:hypothetical protein